MWNLRAYQARLLIESLRALRHWDKTIQQQAFEQWRHALNSSEAGTGLDAASSHNQAPLAVSIEHIQTLRRHIDAIVRNYPRHFNCMRRCLALKSMIEKRGGACTLHIGVKIRQTDKHSPLAAHAWLSINQHLINDSPEKVAEYQEITHADVMFAQLAQGRY